MGLAAPIAQRAGAVQASPGPSAVGTAVLAIVAPPASAVAPGAEGGGMAALAIGIVGSVSLGTSYEVTSALRQAARRKGSAISAGMRRRPYMEPDFIADPPGKFNLKGVGAGGLFWRL